MVLCLLKYHTISTERRDLYNELLLFTETFLFPYVGIVLYENASESKICLEVYNEPYHRKINRLTKIRFYKKFFLTYFSVHTSVNILKFTGKNVYFYI